MITDVTAYGQIPEANLKKEADDFYNKFKVSARLRQLQCMRCANEDNNFVAELETSYGKTKIAIWLAELSKKLGKILVLLSPQLALNSEHVETFTEAGYIVSKWDSTTRDEQMTADKLGDVAIFTYEKFDSIMRKKDNYWIVKMIKWLCIDEIHNIISSRGYAIESEIAKIKMLRKMNPIIRIAGLSATLGNEDLLLKFLDAYLIKTRPDERPVPLVVDYKMIEKEERIDTARNQVKDGLNTLIFTSARKTTEEMAYTLYGDIVPLTELIEHGYGYHHAGINDEDKENGEVINNKSMVENAYRKGKINVLSATATLAAGVNLPAKRVILLDTIRYSTLHGEIPIPPQELLQMMGRAGRNPAIDKVAYASLYIPSKYYEEVTNNLNPQDINSNLEHDINLMTFILEMFVEGFATRIVDLFDCFANTMIKPSSERIGNAIKFLVDNKLLYNNNGNFTASFVGKMCIILYINPYTAIHLRDVYVKEDILPLKLLSVLNTPEFTEGVTVRSEDNTNIEIVVKYLESFKVDVKKFGEKAPNLCKTFALMFRREVTKFAYEKLGYNKDTNKITIYFSSSDYSTLKKSAERILVAGSIIGNTSVKKECSYLPKCIACQTFDKKLISILRIPGLGETRINRLLANKIDDADKFLNASNDDLITIMGRITDDTVVKMKDNLKLILNGEDPIK